MAVNPVKRARAVALFSPTGAGPGLLQPVYAGPDGDNQCYLQVVDPGGLITQFIPVAWPDQGCMRPDREITVAVGDESLWAFAFLDTETPSMLPWLRSRAEMGRVVLDERLEAHPLLSFDIVDLLDLDDLKPAVFTKAFERYRALDAQAAECWRDRSILEPAIEREIEQLEGDAGTGRRHAGGPIAKQATRVRARVQGDRLEVTVDDPLAASVPQMDRFYSDLRKRLPGLFPPVTAVHVQERRTPEAEVMPAPRLTVVVVGRLRASALQPGYWAEQGIEIIDAELMLRRDDAGAVHRLSRIVVLGAQSDWEDLVALGRRLDRASGQRSAPPPVTLVCLASNYTPVLRDVAFQREATCHSVTFFVPFATSARTRRDPLKGVEGLLQILRDEPRSKRRSDPAIAEHSVFLREFAWAGQHPEELACRLAARALRAGVAPDSRARLYSNSDQVSHAAWASLLAPYLEIAPYDGTPGPLTRRSSLSLIAERLLAGDVAERTGQLHSGIRRLLVMRGWKIIEDRKQHLVIGDGQRQFAVAILDDARKLAEAAATQPVPGLGRAALLVIHTEPRRENLLAGNCGQYLHVAIDDVAMMEPHSSWM